VLVGFDGGDLTVRDAEGGRFLAGAAVSYEHLAVAGHWTAGCASALTTAPREDAPGQPLP